MALFVGDDMDARIMAFSPPARTAGMAMPAMMALTRSTMVEKIPLVGVDAARDAHWHVPWHRARGGREIRCGTCGRGLAARGARGEPGLRQPHLGAVLRETAASRSRSERDSLISEPS
jgi:hypothetical protein